MKTSLHIISFFALLFLISACEEMPNQEPVCTIAFPPDNYEHYLGDTLLIAADAFDYDGNISSVNLYLEGNEIGSLSNFPYNFHWIGDEENIGEVKFNVQAFDNKAAFAEDQIRIKVLQGRNPVADFNVSTNEVNTGESVVFNDLSLNNPNKWHWDFGDGRTSTEQNPVHVYVVPGSYSVQLRVENDYGKDTISKEGLITINEEGTPPVTFFTASKTFIDEGQTVEFTDQSANNPDRWLWDFGDGNSSIEQNPVHTYTLPGKYTVSLSASNDFGTHKTTKEDCITVMKIHDAMTDARDGRTYKILKVGNDWWMSENLSYLPSVSYPWEASNYEPHIYVYDYDGRDPFEAKQTLNYQKYGALYNFAAAISSCPDGWHLPSYEEWEDLNDFNNSQGVHEEFFLNITGGRRVASYTFLDIDEKGYYLSSRSLDNDLAFYTKYSASVQSYTWQASGTMNGGSVRCVKDRAK